MINYTQKEIAQITCLVALRLADLSKSEIITTMDKYKIDTTNFDTLIVKVSETLKTNDINLQELYTYLSELEDYKYLRNLAKTLKVKNAIKLSVDELELAVSHVILEQKVLFTMPKAKDLTFVIFDVETTNAEDGYRIIEIGALKVGYKNNELVKLGEYSKFVQVGPSIETMYIFNGQYNISISQLTGITDMMLRDEGIDATTALREFYDFIGDAILVAHNHSFDMGKLGKQFAIKNTTEGDLFLRASICTLAMAKTCFPKGQILDASMNKRVDGHKLGQVSGYCGYVMDEDKAHRAIYDAEFTFYILRDMFKMLGIDENTPANEVILKGLGNKMPNIPKKEEELVKKVKAYYAYKYKKPYVNFEHLNLLTTTNVKFSAEFVEQFINHSDTNTRRRRR